MSYYFFGKIGNHVPKPQPKNYKKQLNKSATGQLGYGGMASYNSGVCQQPQTLTYKRVSQHYRQPCTEVSVLNHPTNRIMHLNEVVHHNRNQTSIFKKSENEPQILNFTLGNIAADNMWYIMPWEIIFRSSTIWYHVAPEIPEIKLLLLSHISLIFSQKVLRE